MCQFRFVRSFLIERRFIWSFALFVQISIEAVKGQGVKGDIAIDDVTWTTGACSSGGLSLSTLLCSDFYHVFEYWISILCVCVCVCVCV